MAGLLRSREAELQSARQDLADAQLRLTSIGGEQTRTQAAERQLAATRAQVEDLNRQVRLLKAALDHQERTVGRSTELVALLRAPGLRVVELAATRQGGSAGARALISGRSRAIFYADNLPVLNAGRTYQLWLIRSAGKPILSGGLFQSGPNQSAILEIAGAGNLDGLTALAVTDEPQGGSPLPTGEKLLIGLLPRTSAG